MQAPVSQSALYAAVGRVYGARSAWTPYDADLQLLSTVPQATLAEALAPLCFAATERSFMDVGAPETCRSRVSPF